jgi:NADP-dependent 3-hydroxy acid dehydrogenase YdfG
LYGIVAALLNSEAQESDHFITTSLGIELKVVRPVGSVYGAIEFAFCAIPDDLHAETDASIRTAVLSPGAVQPELKSNSSDANADAMVREFYLANEISAYAVSPAIAYAIEQPSDVNVNEVVLRLLWQDF